ncbi:MAG: hypothetical protein ACLR1P_00665 [Oscillospiraceae bacterium]
MICGHLGDLEKAQALFAQYYLNAVHAYQREKAHGKQVYLQRGAGNLPRAEHHG